MTQVPITAGAATPPGRLDQPDLIRVGDDVQPPPMWEPDDRRALVLLRNRCWQLCRVIEWRQVNGTDWRCLLRWGTAGELRGGWYVYDPEHVRAIGD